MESKDLFVDEAALTGESFPAEKRPGVLAEETPLGQRTNSLFMGTHVISGDATAVVVRTGAQGDVARRGAECFDPGCFPKLRRRFDDRDIRPGPIGTGNIRGDLRSHAQDPRRPT